MLIFQILLHEIEILRRSSYPQLQFEITLAKICEIGKIHPIKEILSKFEQLSTIIEREGLSFISNSTEKAPSKTWETNKPLNNSYESTKKATLEEIKERPEIKLLNKIFSGRIINIQNH